MNWNSYYMEQAGGGSDYNVYRGGIYQKGYGLGGTFRRFFSWLVPILKEKALPVLKSGAEEVGKTALSTVANIAKDVADGKKISDSSKMHLDTAIDSLKTKAETAIKGKGIKRKKKSKNKVILRKRSKKTDIFD